MNNEFLFCFLIFFCIFKTGRQQNQTLFLSQTLPLLLGELRSQLLKPIEKVVEAKQASIIKQTESQQIHPKLKVIISSHPNKLEVYPPFLLTFLPLPFPPSYSITLSLPIPKQSPSNSEGNSYEYKINVNRKQK